MSLLAPQKTAIVFDLDLTMTKKDTYLGFLKTLLRHDRKRIWRCFFLPFAVSLYYSGLRDNSWLKKAFLKILAEGSTQEQIHVSTHHFLLSLQKDGFYQDALATLEQHRSAGHKLILATASFDFYVQAIADLLKFDVVLCTRSVWTDGGLLCGDINGENCYGVYKQQKLADYFGDTRADWHVIAYSDHYSDLPMLLWADESYAVNPDKTLRRDAMKRHIPILAWAGG